MKHTFHTATGQYEFIEQEFEGETHGAVIAYRELMTAYHGGAGISQKDFNALLDEYLSTGTTKDGAGVWEDMSDFQRGVFQEIKKSLKRTNK